MRYLRKFYQNAEGGGGNNPQPQDDAIKTLAFERDSAKQEAAKLKQRLAELEKSLPTDEQRQKWAEMETAAAKAEEERAKKAGEWDNLRAQMQERHENAMKAKEKAIADEQARAAAIDGELNGTLIGLQFAGAADLFGPSGKTVLLPDVAQAYFANRVQVQTDDKTKARIVVVKDAHGQVILDPKTGNPMEFSKAMAEVIDSHPNKRSLLRGTGRSGSESPGGGNGATNEEVIDASRLTPEQRSDPKVIAQLKKQLPRGAVVFGTAYSK